MKTNHYQPTFDISRLIVNLNNNHMADNRTSIFDLLSLQTFFTSAAIPIIKRKPLTFLGISKQPHYENVWSNIYSFFLKTTGEHHLNELFISSLIELIRKETKHDFNFSTDFRIETEWVTRKNGRIDILLYSDNEAIIIENKVYHHLRDNDLTDYWNSVIKTTKQGIVLSLHKIPKDTIRKLGGENFINITHFEYLQCVMNNLPSYFSTANDKYLIFFKRLLSKYY